MMSVHRERVNFYKGSLIQDAINMFGTKQRYLQLLFYRYRIKRSI